MKYLLTTILLVILANIAIAQAPQAIPYQAVARNSSGSILASTNVSVRFTIRDSVATGTIRYRETHSVTTTPQGLFTANVGGGTPVTGTFSNINWATNAKFLQVEIDPALGSSYIDMGTQQMMSVPYALNAGSVKLRVSQTGDTVFSGSGNFVIIPGISAANITLSIGMSYGGGVIAYILQPGDPGYVAGETHGIIAAPSDQSTGIQWGCYGTLVGGTSIALGTGADNTAILSAACGAGTPARLCADLALNGYSDWYLPSRDELYKLYLNRIVIGGFVTGLYWSSSEASSSVTAWYINLSSGGNLGGGRLLTNNVRAVRSFSYPEAITGTNTVCVGNTTTLSSTTTGGTWSSSNVGVATVSSGGVVSGVSSGTAIISYTATLGSTTSTTTRVVTVNPLPTAGTITGTATVTTGSTTTLSNTTTGGTWSSSNTGIASVGTGGVVTGVASGTATISYTVSNTCGSAVATQVVTVNAAVPLTIGASYGGGKIAYILQPGDPGYIAGETHGLIAAPSDQSTGIQWWNYWNSTTGATGTTLGTGMSNTNAIVAVQGAGSYAAILCAGLVLNGYSDWYLPSKNELTELYLNRSSVGGFSTTGVYWSSSETSSNGLLDDAAWTIYFGDGNAAPFFKHAAVYVRAVRAF